MLTDPPQRPHKSCSFPRPLRRTLLLLLALPLLAGKSDAQIHQDGLRLELGKPIERELSGGTTHSYYVRLKANQFLHVVVEQKGIDVVVGLFAPDGKKVAEVDSPNGSAGPEPISLIALAAGEYRLEVRSLEAAAEAGRYQVKILALRGATVRDRSRIAAQQTYAEAEKLIYGRSAESLRDAIGK